jgi:hypothetical protein
VIQVDEANLPGSPEEWEWAAEAMNRVLDAIPTTPAVHLCFGNYGGQTIQKGGWGQLIDYLNKLHTDHIVMENAHRPVEELAVFKELRPEIGFGLGVVDIKRGPRSNLRIRSPAPLSTPTRCLASAGSNTFIQIAASGCSSAALPMARFARWCLAAISTKAGTERRIRVQSVSSTGHSNHILIRCITRRSTIRRVTDFRSSAWGMLPK